MKSHCNTVFNSRSFNRNWFKNLWVITLHEIISYSIKYDIHMSGNPLFVTQLS